MTTLTTADLVQAVKQSVLSCMADGDWHNVTELRGQVPDDIAQALCDLSRPIVYGDMPDPLDYGRFTLVDAVLRELESKDGVESRERDDKKEVRLTMQKETVKPAVINDLNSSVVEPVTEEAAVDDPEQLAKSPVQIVDPSPTKHDAAKVRATRKKHAGKTENVNGATAASASSEARTFTSLGAPQAPCNSEAIPAPVAGSATVVVASPAPSSTSCISQKPDTTLTGQMPYHQVTSIFPLMEESAFETLKMDIQLHGLLVPIWRFEGMIIDGRHRYRACQELGIEPKFEEWHGRGSLVEFVISLNDRRRHCNESQRAMAAARAKPLFEEESRKRMRAGKAATDPTLHAEEGQNGEAASYAAKMMHVGRDSVYKAQKVVQQGVPELQQAVDAGHVSVSAAADLANLPPEQQLQAVAGGEKSILAKAKEGRKRNVQRQPSSGGRTVTDGQEAPAPATQHEDVEGIEAEVLTFRLPVSASVMARLLVERLGRQAAKKLWTALGKAIKPKRKKVTAEHFGAFADSTQAVNLN